MAIRSEQDRRWSELPGVPNEDVGLRFFTAQNNSDLIDFSRKKEVQADIQLQAIRLARDLDANVADCREKSIALTKLEEALMWTGKAIFKEED